MELARDFVEEFVDYIAHSLCFFFFFNRDNYTLPIYSLSLI